MDRRGRASARPLGPQPAAGRCGLEHFLGKKTEGRPLSSPPILVLLSSKVPESPGQAPDSFVDVFGGFEGEVQPKKRITLLGIGKEPAAGCESHPKGHGPGKQATGGHVSGEAHPDEKTSLGGMDFNGLGKVVVDGRQHGVAALTINPAGTPQMSFVPPDGDEGFQSALDQIGSGQVVNALTPDQMVEDRTFGGEETGPQSGEEHFRKRTDVNHMSAGVKRYEGGKSPPFKTQIPNKIIFEHRDVVARGQGDQIPPPRFAQAGPGRILEVRDRIYQLGMVLLEQGLEVIHNHSPLIAGDSDHLQAKGTEQFQRSGVSRFFHQDARSRPKKQVSHQGQGLLRAGGNQDFLRFGPEPLTGQNAGDDGAQRGMPAFRSVFQRGQAITAQHFLECFSEILDRKEAGIPRTTGKVDR